MVAKVLADAGAEDVEVETGVVAAPDPVEVGDVELEAGVATTVPVAVELAVAGELE